MHPQPLTVMPYRGGLGYFPLTRTHFLKRQSMDIPPCLLMGMTVDLESGSLAADLSKLGPPNLLQPLETEISI